ncbi:MAG: hypothetical protein ABSG67_18430 [Thermoguttaceae bacterium]
MSWPCFGKSSHLARLSGIDPGVIGLPVVGANPGANCNALESSVPVAFACCNGEAFNGSAGSASIAPATSNSFGSV